MANDAMLPKTVYALGPVGTYCHEAASRFTERYRELGLQISLCQSNTLTLAGVKELRSFGVVPIENSSAGLVREVVNFWTQNHVNDMYRFWVVGEIILPIRHCLLVRKEQDDPSSLKIISSHPQALEQCPSIINALGPIELRPALSTAAAAKNLAEDPQANHVGVIASRFAAKQYGLKIWQEDIQDFETNETRFHIISPVSSSKPVSDSGHKFKTAIVLRLKDRPGSLNQALDAISSASANMSSIHSIPLGQTGKFAFYIEFEGHIDDVVTHSVLTILSHNSDHMVVLGSFPKNGVYLGDSSHEPVYFHQ